MMRIKKQFRGVGFFTYFVAGLAFLAAALVAFYGGHFPLAFALAMGGVPPFFVLLLMRVDLLTENFTSIQVVIVRISLVSLLSVALLVGVSAFVRIG